MSKTKPMMQCGHAANATNNATGQPSCAICVGLTPDANLVDERTIDLSGRVATCSGKNPRPSSTSLAFFEYRGPGSHAATNCRHCGYAEVAHQNGGRYKNSERVNPHLCLSKGLSFEPRSEGFDTDIYYCGCRGWD